MDQANNQRDLVIGAYTNYDWEKLRFWANSIDRSGFTGDKAVIAYNSDKTTVDRLLNMGFKVWTFYQNGSSGGFYYPQELVIVVERFYHLWMFLDQLPIDSYRYVITTDAKDVVFQRNPSEWLEKHLGDKHVVASCESLLYRDEPWGDDNLRGSYPMAYDRMKDLPIWNCGVQAGRFQTMKELWLQIWLTCRGAGRHNPDQAAYNLLLSSTAWRSLTRFAMSEDGWACQAGTTVDPSKIGYFRSRLLEPEPKWKDGFSTTSRGEPHYILHQWDRIPEWIPHIERIYG